MKDRIVSVSCSSAASAHANLAQVQRVSDPACNGSGRGLGRHRGMRRARGLRRGRVVRDAGDGGQACGQDEGVHDAAGRGGGGGGAGGDDCIVRYRLMVILCQTQHMTINHTMDINDTMVIL